MEITHTKNVLGNEKSKIGANVVDLSKIDFSSTELLHPELIPIRNQPLERYSKYHFDILRNNVLLGTFQKTSYRFSKSQRHRCNVASIGSVTDELYYDEMIKLLNKRTKSINHDFLLSIGDYWSKEYMLYNYGWLRNVPIRGSEYFKSREGLLEKVILTQHRFWTDFDWTTLKRKEALNHHDLLICGYQLGSIGQLDAAATCFELQYKLINLYNEEMIDPSLPWHAKPYDNKIRIFASWGNQDEMGNGIVRDLINGTNCSRFWLSALNPLGKIYRLQKEYSKAIELYDRMIYLWNGYTTPGPKSSSQARVHWGLGRNRIVECLADRYYCITKVGTAEEIEEGKETLIKYAMRHYNNGQWGGGNDFVKKGVHQRHAEWSNEIPLIALHLYHRLFGGLD